VKCLLICIQYKQNVMDNESLIKVRDSSFTEREIASAKTLLFESVQTTQRLISRRNDGKKRRNIEDIISFFKEQEPDSIPVFVARDLLKLPPISIDHIDAVSLLKDVIKLRNDLQSLKENCVTVEQFQQLQSDVQSVKVASMMNHNINTRKRGE
jgi:hypothetical protein